MRETLSRIGMGGWQVGEKGWGWEKQYGRQDVLRALEKAFELGVNFIDTSEDYGTSEEVVGEFVRKVAGRDNVFLATKVNKDHLRPDDLERACETSRRRLGVDTIDLYQIHDPSMYVPLKETMRAFERLVSEGKVAHIGVSNFPVPLLREAQASLSRGEIFSNQVRYNLIQREAEAEIIPYCKRENIAVIAFSPLAQGALTGKYDAERLPRDEIRSQPSKALFREENLRRLSPLFDALRRVAGRRGTSESQVSLNWLLRDPDLYPIPGFKSEAQAFDNVSALSWRLDDRDWEELKVASDGIKLAYYSTGASWSS